MLLRPFFMRPSRAIALLLAAYASGASAAVTVTGVRGDLLANVAEYFGDQPDCDAGAEAVAEYLSALPERVRPALDAYGYYSAEMDVETLPRDGECWQARLAIEPNEPVTIRDVDVRLAGSADDDAALRSLFAAFPLEPGDPLRHGPYRRFKDRVEVLARQRGYVDGRFTEERIDVHVEQHAADISLAFDSGPRYRFGEVRFETDALTDEVLQSFVGFDEGDPYDAALVAQLQRELAASQYFRQARVTAELDAAADRHIPIRVTAVPDRATSYTVGGGYSTDDGPRVRLAYENERRNRAGHQMHVETLLAQVRQSASFEYRIPVGNPQRDWLSYRAGAAREDIVAGVGTAARLGARRTRVRDAGTITTFLDALLERDEIAAEEFSSQMLIPGASWARTQSDDLRRPREGHRISAVALIGIGSEVSLAQLDVRGKWITATRWDARVLIRGRVGMTFEDGDFVDVPLSMRFFAGGDNSVRGYDFESLGPRNALGELIGGNRLVEASIEYEHPIEENWSAAVFVDAGNAFLDSGPDVRAGAGVGARWFSPIGPVRVDLAWPLDGPDRSPELHLSLSPDL